MTTTSAKKEERDVGSAFRQGGGDTSTDTERQGSYDFRYNTPLAPYAEKVEWSCAEAGSWQKLSFLFLVLTFLGHSIAVCTPYWVVGYLGDQMSLYEGVWLSCYREQGLGRWVCSNYDTIRDLFEQPPWYEASQICAVLSVILLLPALVAATLYSYVVSLSGRSRASWVLVCFLSSSGFCSFLSFVVYGAGYPIDQEFPPGSARFHASFGLQIISFLFCLLTLATHLKDSYSALKVWDNNKTSDSVRPVSSRGFQSAARGPYVTSGPKSKPSSSAPRQTSGAPRKLPSFSLAKFPSALSRFRSKGDKSAPPPPPPPPQPIPLVDSPDRVDVREVSAERVRPMPAPPSLPPPPLPTTTTTTTTYRSYAASSGGGSLSGYDSQV
ncbi:uncharacterized protein LOC143290938 [Babylonia areolata]|uniref:uncharacterized protein LOC143290938 n=1 Tax=Babylonia areolata TaxID=304850 RepID=UPI003FCFE839